MFEDRGSRPLDGLWSFIIDRADEGLGRAAGGGFGETPTRIGLALPKRLRRLLLSQASRPASLRRLSTSTAASLRLHWSG